MRAPLVPGREARRWVVDGLTAVELTGCRHLDARSPRGELVVGHRPRRVWRVGLALVETPALLGRADLEVAHLDRRAEVCRGLTQGGALVPAPEAVVDDDVAAQHEDAKADLDEPA